MRRSHPRKQGPTPDTETCAPDSSAAPPAQRVDGPPPGASAGGLILGWRLPEAAPRSVGFHPGPATRLASPTRLDPLRDTPEGHVVMIARTGTGKNRCGVMPWLLTYPGSVVVTDTKGENALVTGRQRMRLGQRTVVFNMFGVQAEQFRLRGMPPAHYNPLEGMAALDAEDLADTSMALAELLAGPASMSLQDPFWRSSALGLIAGLIAWQVVQPRFDPEVPAVECSLGGVWRTLNCDDLSYRLAMTLDRFSDKPGFPVFIHEQFANFLQGEAEKVRTSVRSEATSLLRVFASPRVQQSMSSSDVGLETLADPDVAASIFLVMPPDRLESHSGVLRCLLGLILMAIARRPRRPQWPTLVVIDELAQLGPLPVVKTAITLLRGYGAKLVLCVQSLAQLRGLWPLDYETILDNAALVNFGNASMSGAAGIAERLGDIDAQTLFALPPDQLAVHLPGERTVIAHKLDYLSDAAFAGLFDPNPYYESVLRAGPR